MITFLSTTKGQTFFTPYISPFDVTWKQLNRRQKTQIVSDYVLVDFFSFWIKFVAKNLYHRFQYLFSIHNLPKMSSLFPKNSSNSQNKFEELTSSINEALKQFSDFTSAINEVCNQASSFGRSLQTLESLTMPEIIGGEHSNVQRKTQVQKFTSAAHLSDTLVTFSK